MLDLHKFRKRENAIRKTIGVCRDYTVLDERNAYSTYFNPSTGLLTGVRDNERNIFYHFKQEDFIQFVSMVNHKELRYSEFNQSVESLMKQYVDREIELFDRIKELELTIDELKEKNKNLEHQQKMVNINF